MAKKKQYTVVMAPVEDTDELVSSFGRAIMMLGGYVYDHPAFEGSDMVGLIVSSYPLSKKQIGIIAEDN